MLRPTSIWSTWVDPSRQQPWNGRLWCMWGRLRWVLCFVFGNWYIILCHYLTHSTLHLSPLDDDTDCKGDLVCFQSDTPGAKVPGCLGRTTGGNDYCFHPTQHTGNPALTYAGDGLFENSGYLYKECEGDCEFARWLILFYIAKHNWKMILPSTTC